MDQPLVAQRSKPTERNTLLQELRGIAALAVVVFHVKELLAEPRALGHQFHAIGSFLPAIGPAAVDFFFALSGFLMIFIHRQEEGHPEYRGLFFLKRGLRIFPPWWAFLCLVFPLYLYSSRFESNSRDLSARKIVETFLLLPQESGMIIPPSWSLTYELFFYLIFGLIFFARPRAFLVVSVLWFAGILSVSANSSAQNLLTGNKWLAVAFDFRNVGFLAGCLAGWLTGVVGSRTRRVGFWLGVTLFVLLEVMDIESKLGRTLSAYLFSIGSTLILVGSTAVDLGKRRWLLLLGDASYSIYITHWSAILWMIRLGGKLQLGQRIGPLATFIVTVLCVVAVGVLFHLAIERRLLNATRTWVHKRKVGSV